MKRVLTILILLFVFASFGLAQGLTKTSADSVKVTFVLNTSTIKDTVGTSWFVNIRGEAPFTWDEKGPKLTNTQGDYWKVTVTVPKNQIFKYKFYVANDKDGTSGQGWEAGFKKLPATEDWDTRYTKVGTTDTVLPVQFFNKDVNDQDRAWTPLTHGTDSLAVLFRINMKSFGDFNPEKHVPIIRGDLVGTGWDWNKNLVLKREGTTGNAADLWSAVLVMPKDKIGDRGFKYFVINKEDIEKTGWDFTRVADDNEGGDRKFTLRVDTTLKWVWWGNKPVAAVTGKDTIIVKYTIDVSTAVRSRGFKVGDATYKLLVSTGWNGTGKNMVTGENPSRKFLQRQGTTFLYFAQDTIIGSYNADTYYKYYVAVDGVEDKEKFYNFDYAGDDVSAAEARILKTANKTLLNIFDTVISVNNARRQPDFKNKTKLTKNVTVTVKCDLRPAYYNVLGGVGLFDIQGNNGVFNADSVYRQGVWINGPMTNGWTGWGSTLRDSLSKKMYDDGTHGDAVAGDKIYTTQLTVGPQYTDSRNTVNQEFKFGVNGGDNEGGKNPNGKAGGFGNNHFINIDDNSTTFTIDEQFGTINTSYYKLWDYNKRIPVASAADSVKVTFVLNTSTIKDTVGTSWFVNIRGEAPFTWDEKGPKLTNTQGDYWKVTVTVPKNQIFKYKFYVANDKDGTSGQGWESSFKKLPASEDWDTRYTKVGTVDTVIPVQFFNKDVNDQDRAWTPLTHGVDSLAVLFRINMKSFGDFNPEKHVPIIRGDLVGAGWDWNKNLVLKREGTTGNAADLWSAVLVMPKDKIGDRGFKYFVINKEDIEKTGWDFTRVADDNEGGDRKFTLRVDTTLKWVWWGNKPVAAVTGKDTIIVKYTIDVSTAVRSRGFKVGDATYKLLVSTGWNGTGKNMVTGENPSRKFLQRQGTTFLYFAQDTIIGSYNADTYYKYYVAVDGVEDKEKFYNFDYAGDDVSAAEARILKTANKTLLNIFDTVISVNNARRQPDFKNKTKLTKNVTVTVKCDLRPAYYNVLGGVGLFDIQGNNGVFNADSVYKQGVWINGPMTGGWTGWGSTLRDSLSKKMYDDGTHGDAVAGDNIYTCQLTVGPMYTDSRNTVNQEFKFGVNGGDNEGGKNPNGKAGGFGNNHFINIDDNSTTFTIDEQFGTINTSYYKKWDYNKRLPGGASITKNLNIATEVGWKGAIAKGLLFKPGKILDNGNTIWLCGHEIATATGRNTWTFLSTDGGKTFKQGAQITGRVSNVDAFSKTDAVVATADGKILKTKDGGTTWKEVHSYQLPSSAGFFDGIQIVGDSVVIAFGDGENGNDIYFCRSTDKGETFKVIPASSIPAYGGNVYGYFSYGTCMASYGKNVWCATYGGGTNGYVIKSTDAGVTWTSVELTTANTRFNSIAFNDANNGMGVDNARDVFYTKDGGKTWTKAVKPAAKSGTTTVYCVASVPNTSLFVTHGIVTEGTANTSGAFYSDDDGTTWSQIPAPLTPSAAQLIGGIYLNANTGYALSNGGWVLKLGTETPTSIEPIAGNLPTTYSLEQNYPNPFNPETTIRYSLAKEGKVTLRIYDMLGREVKTLVNENQTAGRYEVRFNANSLSSGAYLYYLQTNEFTSTKKMLLMK